MRLKRTSLLRGRRRSNAAFRPRVRVTSTVRIGASFSTASSEKYSSVETGAQAQADQVSGGSMAPPRLSLPSYREPVFLLTVFFFCEEERLGGGTVAPLLRGWWWGQGGAHAAALRAPP